MKKFRYNLTLPMVKLYYNILGVDETLVNFDDVKLNVGGIEEISPLKYFDYVDILTHQLDDNMILLLEKMSCDGWDYSEEIQKKYFNSVNVILKAVSNLNLIPVDSEDYVLYYRRLSYVLNIVISEINGMKVSEIIKLAHVINEGVYDKIDEFSYLVPNTSNILLLSMNPNDIKDYMMYKDKREFIIGRYEFNGKEVNLRIGEVFRLIRDNMWEKSDVSFDDNDFKRLSFKKVMEITNQSRVIQIFSLYIEVIKLISSICDDVNSINFDEIRRVIEEE